MKEFASLDDKEGHDFIASVVEHCAKVAQQLYDEMDEENMETVVEEKRKQDQSPSASSAPGTDSTYGYV